MSNTTEKIRASVEKHFAEFDPPRNEHWATIHRGDMARLSYASWAALTVSAATDANWQTLSAPSLAEVLCRYALENHSRTVLLPWFFSILPADPLRAFDVLARNTEHVRKYLFSQDDDHAETAAHGFSVVLSSLGTTDREAAWIALQDLAARLDAASE